MFLGGSINLRTPDLEEKEITFKSDVSAEFYLNTKRGTKPTIDDFGISVELDKDEEVVMSTNIEQDDVFCDHLFIDIESKGIGGVGLSLSIEQVCTLIQILERFREGYYAVRALAMERVVKAA